VSSSDASDRPDRGDAGGSTELCWAERDGEVLRLGGEIDICNAPEVTDWIVTAVRDGASHLDLSAVRFCGAAGVRALLTGRDAVCADDGRLHVICSPQVLRALWVCGLTDGPRLVAHTAAPTTGVDGVGTDPTARGVR
jgi:anti-anti-sigma factor